jgi:RNA polymerase sigma factor (sigma-70 family)
MPNHPPDWELLREYAKTRSDAAFAELVRRYIDFVYSTALRRTHRDTHLAEDITQAVFVILARKAGTIRAGVVLSGWLHRAARYVAANALRREYRHDRRRQALRDSIPRQEPTAMPDQSSANDSAPDWEAVAPLLDVALDRLRQRDRDAVLLRFMQGMSHREIGQAIGITEEAARKRTERALSRLREFFVARGVSVPAGALAVALASSAVEAAPPALVCATVSTSAGAAPLADAALRMMMLAKAKLVAFATVAALLVSTSVAVVVTQVARPERPRARAPDAPPTLPAKPVLAQQPPANTAIEGTIHGLDGEPLPGAEVFLATPGRPYRGFKPNPADQPPLITEADGKFSFPAPSDEAFIVARHLDGHAQLPAKDLAASPRVFIKPWARIDGVLMDGDAPQAGRQVFVGVIEFANEARTNSIIHQTTTKTDRDGRFSFERLPPGPVMLCRHGQSWAFSSKWERVELTPGATARVQLGGIGQHVIGKLLPPERSVPGLAGGAIPWDDQRLMITTVIEIRRTELRPEDSENFHVTHAENYHVLPDGTFRIEDLRPGRYALAANLYQLDRPTSHSERIAVGKTSFVVPPLPAGRQRATEPVEVPAIRMEPVSRLLVGEAAPDFEVRSLDGKPIKLADYRGKYLLAWFRYSQTHDLPGLGSERHGQLTWYRPGGLRDADWVGLHKAHAAFANDSRFAMLAIEVEDPRHRETIADAARRHGAQFPLATTPRTDGDGKPLDPAYTFSWGLVLIDPQGRVAAKNFSPANAQQVVAKALLEAQ